MKAFFIFFGAMLIAELPAAEPLQLANMSVRLTLRAGEIGIAGFVVSNSSGGSDGAGPIRLLVRAAGPSLRQFGVNGSSSRVALQFGSSATVTLIATLGTNPSAISTASASVGAFSFIGFDDDAAIVEVRPGSLTAIARDLGAGGEAIIEVYKLPVPAPTPQPAPIPTPANLVVTRASGMSISLDWDDVSHPDFSRFHIYRSTVNNSNAAEKIAEQRGSSQFIDIVPEIRRYYYWVSAVLLGSREGLKSGVTSGVPATGL